MVDISRTRWLRLLILAVALAAALTACGGSTNPPDPTGVVSVAGSVTLPAGHGLDLEGLSVSTPVGVYPIGPNGEFEAEVYEGARTEVGVETASGALLLLGVTKGKAVNVSIASTAEALMYYLVDSHWESRKWPPLAEAVDHWYDNLDGATFTVTPQ